MVCPACKGTGCLTDEYDYIHDDPCPECGGDGVKVEDE